MAQTQNSKFQNLFPVLILILVIMGGVLFDVVSADAMEDWTYAADIIIDNTGGTEDLTGYQILVELDSDNFDFSKAKSDGGDLRFTLLNGGPPSGNLLPYWIESYDQASEKGRIWVKVYSIPASDTTTIIMHYGNSNAESASSGTSTFELYDVSGIVGFWHMDEDSWSGASGEVKDETGVNDGTAQGGASTTDGKFNRAGSFDGTDDYVDCGNDGSLDITNAVTIEGWVYSDLSGDDNNNHIIVGKTDHGLTNKIQYHLIHLFAAGASNDGKIAFTYHTQDGGYFDYTSNTVLPLQQLVHVAATYDGTTQEVKLYVDGNLDSTHSGHSSLPINSAPVTFAANADGGERWDGTIDEVRIYNRALSEDEISTIYDNYMEKTGSYYNVRKYTDPEPTVTVSKDNNPPELGQIGDKTVNEGGFLEFTVTAFDPDDDPITLSTSTLPTGATFTDNGDGTGDFSWTPDYYQAGTYPVIFTASDGSLTDDEEITITVNNVNGPPELGQIGDRSGKAEELLAFTVTATDPDNDPIILTTSTLPTGATFTDNGDGTGDFSWIPSTDQIGLHSVTFTASDGVLTDDESITITVTPLSDWPYQSTITIDNSGNTESLTDYQVLVALDNANFEFIKAQPNGEDIRFTLLNGDPSSTSDLLPYWIESYNQANEEGRIWVKVGSIPASDSTSITMYYGNSAAGSVSNGTDTFEFFDSWENGTLDGWTKSGTWGGNNGVTTDWTTDGDYALFVHGGATYSTSYYKDYDLTDVGKIRFDVLTSFYNTNDFVRFKVGGATLWEKTGPPWTDEWTESLDQEIDVSSYSGSTELRLASDILASWNQQARGIWDSVFGRKYTSPEPTITITEDLPPTPTPTPQPPQIVGGGAGGGGHLPPSSENIPTDKNGKITSTTILLSPDETTFLKIPEGTTALDAEKNPLKSIRIRSTSVGGTLAAYNLGPDGATFNPEISLTVSYNPNDVPEEKTIVIKMYDGGKWIPLETIVDTVTNTAEAKISHFTIFALFLEESTVTSTSDSVPTPINTYTTENRFLSGDSVLIFLSAQNPIENQDMTVKVSLNVPSGVSVNITETDSKIDFVRSGSGQYTGTFFVIPKEKQHITLKVESDRVGEFSIESQTSYYFGNDTTNQKTLDRTFTFDCIAQDNQKNPPPGGGIGVLPELRYIWVIVFAIILGGATLIVDLKGNNKNQKNPIQKTTSSLSLTDDNNGNIIYLKSSIIEKMEIRVESVFRPNQEDVEIIYALSGSDFNIPDKIHYLASNQVVLASSSTFVSSYNEKIIENILKEREDIPKIIIHIHTHPMGIPNLSETDKLDNIKTIEMVNTLDSRVNIIFGVHAISSESIRQKTDPKASNNKIKWSSIHREHEIGFYDKNGKPKKVKIFE